KCLPIEGFDLGNSPLEFTREKVGGKTLVMTTTNGTAAMSLTTSAAKVFIGSLLNMSTIVSELVRLQADPVLICAGREKHFSLEDAACAGEFARRVMAEREGDWTLNDGAQAALALVREFGIGEDLFARSAGGKSSLESGLTKDLAFCAQVDVRDIIPVLHERSITLQQPLIGTSV